MRCKRSLHAALLSARWQWAWPQREFSADDSVTSLSGTEPTSVSFLRRSPPGAMDTTGMSTTKGNIVRALAEADGYCPLGQCPEIR
jgi:hypothetical protein